MRRIIMCGLVVCAMIWALFVLPPVGAMLSLFHVNGQTVLSYDDPRLPGAAEPAVRLAGVGDMMLARSLGAALARDPQDSPFTAVVASVREADVTVGNLECALGTGGTRAQKTYTFLAPPAAATSLADAGFDVVSLANNHSLDFGPEALADTVRLLDAAGVRHAGAGRNSAAARRPAVLASNGLRLAFLAYADTPSERAYSRLSWEATAERAGIAWAQPDTIAADVAAARSQADIVVVLLHSGSEGQRQPNAVQKAAAHAAVDAGAALVLGAHPHVLQGAERYKGGLIVYSLGNFVFDGFSGTGVESAILTATLTRNGVQDWHWTPVVLRAGRPQIAQGQAASRILARIDQLSRKLRP